MWHPAERVKHDLPPGDWPTEKEASKSRWFSPVDIGPLTLEHRTWVPAMVPWRATEDGMVTEDVLDWYERFAGGRPGAIVVEATGVRDIPSGPLLRIGDDRFLPGLHQLVETVRRASGGHTRLFIQLIDFLSVKRRPEPEKFFRRFLEIDDTLRGHFPGLDDDGVREALIATPDGDLDGLLDARTLRDLRFGYRESVSDTHLPHVAELPDVMPPIFAAAAGRARQAGFDGVELHYAHAYTMSSFLSALNVREDGYGGVRENRVRLPLEVYAAVREAVGADYTVGCRYLSDDIVEGGSGVDDAAWFGAQFATAGMDFLSLSRGGRFEDAKQPKVGWAVYPYTGQSGWECMPTVVADDFGPFGRNSEPAARIRAAVREAGCDTPVVVAGGICSFSQAEAALESGAADIVGAARQTLADPDWFEKVRLGRGEEVRRCVFTNYCEALDQKHKKVTCQLWTFEDTDEPGVKLSGDGKRRLVAPDWES